MTVAFIGSNNHEWGKTSMKRLSKEITKLVEREGADVFLFTDGGVFDDACWVVVTQLLVRYPNIRRVYARTKNDDYDDRLKKIGLCYECTFLIDAVRDAGIFAQSVRNEAIVEMCDVLVTCFDMKKLPSVRIKSVTEMAVEYARQRKKRIINII